MACCLEAGLNLAETSQAGVGMHVLYWAVDAALRVQAVRLCCTAAINSCPHQQRVMAPPCLLQGGHARTWHWALLQESTQRYDVARWLSIFAQTGSASMVPLPVTG